MRESYGVEGSGLQRLVRGAYDLLELITFFTAGEDKEAVGAAHSPRHHRARGGGDDPHRDHGSLHQSRGDRLEQLVESGGYVAAREKGVLRVEGRDYVVQDGDVITIRV